MTRNQIMNLFEAEPIFKHLSSHRNTDATGWTEYTDNTTQICFQCFYLGWIARNKKALEDDSTSA